MEGALVSATATNIVTVLLPVGLDDFSRLTPLEVIRVKQRVHKNDDVHEGRGEEVEEVSNKVLSSLEVVAWKPETDAERIQLKRSVSHVFSPISAFCLRLLAAQTIERMMQGQILAMGAGTAWIGLGLGRLGKRKTYIAEP